MANTRFAYTNMLEAATILNAPSADAAYPAANSKNGERYIPWRSGAGPPSPVDIEFDLGSAKAVEVAALFNISTQISSIAVESATSGAGPWTNRATITPAGAADKGAVFAAQTFRYWRFRLTNSGQFTVGELWISAVDADAGVIFSAGTVKSISKNRSRERNPSGVQHSFYNGRVLHAWDFLYSRATDAMRAIVETVVSQQKSVVLIDDASAVYQVEADDGLGWSVVFTNLQDFRIRFEELF